jgi:hypothetical protein
MYTGMMEATGSTACKNVIGVEKIASVDNLKWGGK